MMKTQTVITDSDTNPNVANPSATREIQYRQGTMRRRDIIGEATTASIADIANCETRVGFFIDLEAHEYRNYKLVKFASEAQRGEYLRKTGKTAVQVESKTVDTGERKVLFGHPQGTLSRQQSGQTRTLIVVGKRSLTGGTSTMNLQIAVALPILCAANLIMWLGPHLWTIQMSP